MHYPQKLLPVNHRTDKPGRLQAATKRTNDTMNNGHILGLVRFGCGYAGL